MNMDDQKILSLENVGLKIGDKTILSDISFSLMASEIVTIVGPNGAGKSSLLSVVLGLTKPTSGQVYLNEGLKIGYVPQLINRDYSLPISVYDFIKLSYQKAPKDQIKQMMDEMNVTHLSNRMFYQLSGGEMRRVLLVRALLNTPSLLVLDEPTAGVDVNGQIEFYQKIDRLRAQIHFSVLMVSHDLHLVMSSTDHVICLNTHVCCSGQPSHVIDHPVYKELFVHSKAQQPVSFYQHNHNHQHS